MDIFKEMKQFEKEAIQCIEEAIHFEGVLTYKAAEEIAEYLLCDVNSWVGVDAYSEAIVGFFAHPSKELKQAIGDKDFQEVGVLLAEDVRKEIVNVVLMLNDEIEPYDY